VWFELGDSNPHGKLSNNLNLRFIKAKSGNIYMEKTLKVELFLNFIEAFIVCVLLGYLLHDLTYGILAGIGCGFGICMGKINIKRREKRKQEEAKRIR